MDQLASALKALRTQVAAVRLPLAVPGQTQAIASQQAAVEQLDDYLLPRVDAAGAPMLVVVGGSTGAGKSTLVNSILGQHVSASGVLRPTTRSPVLVYHPDDAEFFTSDRILPGLARVTGDGSTSARALQLVPSDALPVGLALLDAPDVDSIETANRELAAKLLAAADLWLFVTTAARYADAVPWDLLTAAAARRAQVALVLDRVDAGAEQAITADLRRLATENGLGESRIFVVPEAPLDAGLLPESSVAEISTWLDALGADPDSRTALITATRDGVIDDLVGRSIALAAEADTQRQAAEFLRQIVAHNYSQASEDIITATSSGTMLRGEVLSRWQDFVGTSEFFRNIEQGIGKIRDSIVRVFKGQPVGSEQVEQSIATGLQAVILDASETAAERTYNSWRSDPAGAALLSGLDLSRGSADLRGRIAEEVRAWQGDVLELVRAQAAHKRSKARALSFGVNVLSLSLMVTVFALTGGLTGAELGIAGGSAVVGQKLLEAVFGDDAVRRLASEAKAGLQSRVEGLLATEAERFTGLLDQVKINPSGGQALREVALQVQTAAASERATRIPARTGAKQRLTHFLRGDPAQRNLTQGDGASHAGSAQADDEVPAPKGWRKWFGRRPKSRDGELS